MEWEDTSQRIIYYNKDLIYSHLTATCYIMPLVLKEYHNTHMSSIHYLTSRQYGQMSSTRDLINISVIACYHMTISLKLFIHTIYIYAIK